MWKTCFLIFTTSLDWKIRKPRTKKQSSKILRRHQLGNCPADPGASRSLTTLPNQQNIKISWKFPIHQKFLNLFETPRSSLYFTGF
jgi:hypothetical protein